eukprot:914683-Amphidinium_carterae.1
MAAVLVATHYWQQELKNQYVLVFVDIQSVAAALTKGSSRSWDDERWPAHGAQRHWPDQKQRQLEALEAGGVRAVQKTAPACEGLVLACCMCRSKNSPGLKKRIGLLMRLKSRTRLSKSRR